MGGMVPHLRPLLAAVLCCTSLSLIAQDQATKDQFAKAAALYYTPSKSGLDSFHCDVTADWQAMLEKSLGKALDADNPLLKFLDTAKMSVDDNLKTGVAEFHWATGNPPEGMAPVAQMMHDGLDQTMNGFFQAWNPFVTGELVDVTGGKLSAEENGGVVLSATAGKQAVESHFDNQLLLTSMHVKLTGMELTMKPKFDETPQGRVITGMDSDYTSAAMGGGTMRVTMHVKYADVTGYELPSELTAGAGDQLLTFHFSGCTVNPVAAP